MANQYNSMQYEYRPALSKFTIETGLGTVGKGTAIAPLVSNTGGISGSYIKFDQNVRGFTKVKRAPTEKIAEKDKRYGKRTEFVLTDRSVAIPVADEDLQGKPSEIFDELAGASMDALAEIQQAHELDVKAKVWASSKAGFESLYASNVVEPQTKWNASGGSVKETFAEIRRKIYLACGYYPTDAFFTEAIWEKLIGDTTNDFGKRYVNNTIELPTMEQMAKYIGFERIHVLDNLEDTAPKAGSRGFMYDGDHILCAKIDTSNRKRKMNFMNTMYFESTTTPFLGISTKYNDDRKATMVQCGAYYDILDVSYKAGGVIYAPWNN